MAKNEAVWGKAEEITKRWLAGERQTDLAIAFGVSQHLISQVVRYEMLGNVAPSETGARVQVHRSAGLHLLRVTEAPTVPFLPPNNPKPRVRPIERFSGESEKFWGQVQRGTGCWLWQGNVAPNGYGRFSQGHDNYELAHRVAWRLTYSEVPDEKKICHRCDVRACCRPDHLFCGTQKDNIHDKVTKKRSAMGVANGSGKLTWKQVCEMRQLREQQGLKLVQLATKFNVTAAQVSNIVNYRQRRTC